MELVALGVKRSVFLRWFSRSASRVVGDPIETSAPDHIGSAIIGVVHAFMVFKEIFNLKFLTGINAA